jgi:1-acyl-sn-glycerol-3-phosphate acyltransferase
MRLRVAHTERVPLVGTVLLVSNHLGPTDQFAIVLHLRREVRMLAKAELFEWPIIGWVGRVGQAVPVRRGASDRTALRTIEKLLEGGQCVLVFPEGTYADPPDPAAMIPLKTGAAWLALRTGAPIVPVGIWGTERVWRTKRGWRPWWRPRVGVLFGEPYIPPAAPNGNITKATLNAVTDEMARRIAALVPEEYRGHYASTSRLTGT